MKLCNTWAKVFNTAGYQVLVFGERLINEKSEREYKLTFMTDLGRYNAGSISYSIMFQGWFDQARFDEQTTNAKITLAMKDMVTQYNQQIMKGASNNIRLDIVNDLLQG
jgi:hypothetical protein